MPWPLALLLVAGLQLPGEDGCKILDKTQPPQYLTYERFGDAVADDKHGVRHVVWLRFHNNTSCTLILPGSGQHRSRADIVEDGVEWSINYAVFREYRRVLPFCFAACGDWDLRPTDALAPGRSAVFQVLQSHFMTGERIAVEYSYAWERPFGLGIFGAPFTNFDGGTIPQGDRRRFRK